MPCQWGGGALGEAREGMRVEVEETVRAVAAVAASQEHQTGQGRHRDVRQPQRRDQRLEGWSEDTQRQWRGQRTQRRDWVRQPWELVRLGSHQPVRRGQRRLGARPLPGRNDEVGVHRGRRLPQDHGGGARRPKNQVGGTEGVSQAPQPLRRRQGRRRLGARRPEARRKNSRGGRRLRSCRGSWWGWREGGVVGGGGVEEICDKYEGQSS